MKEKINLQFARSGMYIPEGALSFRKCEFGSFKVGFVTLKKVYEYLLGKINRQKKIYSSPLSEPSKAPRLNSFILNTRHKGG